MYRRSTRQNDRQCRLPRGLDSHILRIDIGQQFGDVRNRTLLGELHGLVHPGPGRGPNLGEAAFLNAQVFQALLEQSNRIALAPLLHFFLGPVLLEEIGGAVGHDPVGEGLDGERLAGIAHAPGRFVGDLSTASISMPSTLVCSIPYDSNFLPRSVWAVARSTLVPIPYWLFSRMKRQGFRPSRPQ